MTPKDIVKVEIARCNRSPYYFATKYLRINGKPFTTLLSEKEFNKHFLLLKIKTTDYAESSIKIKGTSS